MALPILYCNESIDEWDSDEFEQNEDHIEQKFRMSIDDKYCEQCLRIEHRRLKEKKYPLRLSHLASLACLKLMSNYLVLDLQSNWFTELEKQFDVKKSGSHLICIENRYYTTCSILYKIIKNIRQFGFDNYTNINRYKIHLSWILKNLLRIQAFCCCCSVSTHCNDPKCENFDICQKFKLPRFQSHRRNLCCCDGFLNMKCFNYLYVKSAIVEHFYGADCDYPDEYF